MTSVNKKLHAKRQNPISSDSTEQHLNMQNISTEYSIYSKTYPD